MTSTRNRRATILIVDDHAVMRDLARGILQHAFPGSSILEASRGEAAIELCSAHEPDVVLTDIQLLGENGFELARTIRSLLPRTQVIIMSVDAEKAYVEQAHAAGAFAFLSKEHLNARLPALVAQALEIDGSDTASKN